MQLHTLRIEEIEYSFVKLLRKRSREFFSFCLTFIELFQKFIEILGAILGQRFADFQMRQSYFKILLRKFKFTAILMQSDPKVQSHVKSFELASSQACYSRSGADINCLVGK